MCENLSNSLKLKEHLRTAAIYNYFQISKACRRCSAQNYLRIGQRNERNNINETFFLKLI